jgi:probable phosphoglycerate mutase
MRIIIVRHGEPNYDNDCLTPLGHKQAEAAALRLLDEGIEAVYSSPLGRAKETAGYTARRLDLPDVEELDFMRELRWGSKDGNPIFEDGHPWSISDKMAETGIDLRDENWPENEYYNNNIVTKNVKFVEEETDKWLETLGYKREGLYYRNQRKNNDQYTVALFCHGGSSSAMIGHILNQTFPYVCATQHADFTGITILRFSKVPGSLCAPSLEIACDARHIKGVTL